MAPSKIFDLPKLSALPPVKGEPQGCAWGVFDKDGERDQLGTLNFLTAEGVREAAKAEIQTGERVQLDWSLNNVEFPGFNRKEFSQKIIDLAGIGFVGCDDEIHINTQSGSQWDGFRHVAHQTTGYYYNVVSGKNPLDNGIQNWCDAGGIVGRGVLLDWLAWKEKQGGEVPHPCTRHEIPVSELDAVANAQGIVFKPGDVLLIRSGFVKWHDEEKDEGTRKAKTQDDNKFIGLKANEESKNWLWDHRFAAVGGDTVAFEAWPPKPDCMLHEWLLTHWGTPIGEMWDLEKLAEVCKREKRYSFFLTSAPLRVPGGVGSTPNAIAIF